MASKEQKGKAGAPRPMTRDLPTFNLRMPPELREQLEKEAGISGRSLNAEVVARLKMALSRPRQAYRAGVEQEVATYGEMTDAERELLAIFRRWPAAKQLALLSLFK